MFERIKAAFKAFVTSLPGATGAAAKAFYGDHPGSVNYPNTAAAIGNTIEKLKGVFNNLPISKLRDYQSYLWAGSKKVWAVWKSCDLVSKIIQETPRKIVRVNGNKETEVTDNAELNALISKPNERETFNELLARVSFHLKMTGNAFIAKDSPNILGEMPSKLYVLNPRRIMLSLGKSGEVIGYLYIVGNGQTIPFDVQEVIHIKLPHPDQDYWGLGEMEAGEAILQDYINRQTWLEKFWENGASPSGILFEKSAQITDKDEWEKAKKKWQQEYGGAANSGKTAWLTGDWDYLQMGLTAQEMQSIESSTWSVEQVCHLCGVPLSVMGVKEAANYATAQVDDVRMRRYTVKPLLSIIEDKLNDDLIAGFDENLRLRFQIQGLIDIEQSSRSIPLLVGAAVMSPNDARELMGMERVADPLMDGYYLLNTMVPIALAGMTNDQTDAESQDAVQKFIQDMFAKQKAALAAGTTPPKQLKNGPSQTENELREQIADLEKKLKNAA
jgi:HK97 family phage portal protein